MQGKVTLSCNLITFSCNQICNCLVNPLTEVKTKAAETVDKWMELIKSKTAVTNSNSSKNSEHKGTHSTIVLYLSLIFWWKDISFRIYVCLPVDEQPALVYCPGI